MDSIDHQYEVKTNFSNMKHLILVILCVSISFLSCLGQQSLSNPLYLGPILIDKPSVEAMAKVCEQYKLTEVPSDDDCKAYRYMDGTLIKFNIVPDSEGNKQPYVENTTESKKNIEKILESTGFHKGKNRYEKGYHGARRFSTCQISGNQNKRIVFTKENGNINTR